MLGKLDKVVEGRRERMKDGEGQLGEGGATAVISGTVFHKVAATGKLQVVRALRGAKDGQGLALQFELQSSKLNDGATRRFFLLSPRVLYEDGMQGLFVLEKQKGKEIYAVTQVLRLDPAHDKGKDAGPAFAQRAADCFTINARAAALNEALEAARQLVAADKKVEAKAVLQKAWEAEIELERTDSIAERKRRVDPLENQVKEQIAALDKGGK
jgi:hypothetical protein